MKRIGSAVLVFGLATFLLLTTTSIAPAAEAGPYYVGIFGGYVIPDDLKVEGPGGSADVSLKESWTLGAKFGYIVPKYKWLAFELEYAYLAEQDLDEPGADGNFSANNLMVNVIFRYPEGKIHPYIGGGIGWSWCSFKASEPGVGSVDESDNAFGWQIIAGVNFEITPKWSADLAYRYFSSKYTINSGGDDVDVTTKNSMILIGVNYHF